jgi:hypothetical protein
VRKQDRERRLRKQALGGAAEDEFAPSRMPIGAHHENVDDCRPTCARHAGPFSFTDEIGHWSLFNGVVAVASLTGFVGKVEEQLEQDATEKQRNLIPYRLRPAG